MVSSRLFAGFMALASFHAVNAGACRPRPSSTVLTGTDTSLTTAAETSFQTSIEPETTPVTSEETTTFETTISLTSAETSIETSFVSEDEPTTTTQDLDFTTDITSFSPTSTETSFVTEDDLTTTQESTQSLDFTTDITSFITLTADPTTSEVAATTSVLVPADFFPCETEGDCNDVSFCDTQRCGCVGRVCVIQASISVPLRL
ncbi:hypothetical protein FLONG3_3376 [Fusarium longipes]|uniref:Uncharacterized protein n=1 Tax=Fusarium longipes TaxID=694270 RepID=A0A395T131_9HYPO|nr:hypothetical protein FLONG3_3376 [Fusarium longipes]